MGGFQFSAAFIGPKNDILDFLRAIALRPGQCHTASENTRPATAHEKIERAFARATLEQEYRIAQDFENNAPLHEHLFDEWLLSKKPIAGRFTNDHCFPKDGLFSLHRLADAIIPHLDGVQRPIEYPPVTNEDLHVSAKMAFSQEQNVYTLTQHASLYKLTIQTPWSYWANHEILQILTKLNLTNFLPTCHIFVGLEEEETDEEGEYATQFFRRPQHERTEKLAKKGVTYLVNDFRQRTPYQTFRDLEKAGIQPVVACCLLETTPEEAKAKHWSFLQEERSFRRTIRTYVKENPDHEDIPF